MGAPFFNLFFVPLMSVLMLFISLGFISRWKKTDSYWLASQLWPAAAFTVILSLVFPFIYGVNYTWQIIVGVALSAWVISSTLLDVYRKASVKAGLWAGLKKLSLSYYGMILAHMGVAVTAMGICIVSNYTQEHDIRVEPGDTVDASGYHFIFDCVQ